MELLIVGFGPVAGYKYSRCIYNAVSQGHLSRYHVIDRESQQEHVKARLSKLPIQPASCTYIPEQALQKGTNSGIEWLIQKGLFMKSENKKKIVITTEPQSHGAYISYAFGREEQERGEQQRLARERERFAREEKERLAREVQERLAKQQERLAKEEQERLALPLHRSSVSFLHKFCSLFVSLLGVVLCPSHAVSRSHGGESFLIGPRTLR